MYVLVLFMSDAAKRERAEQILGELAELSLMLARDLAVQARAAETPEERAVLTEAFHKTSRSVRLTLALSFKLDRDAAHEAREAAREAEVLAAEAALREQRAAEPAPRRVTPEENQKRRVKNVLNRLLWNESEGDEEEYDVLLEDLDTRLYEIEDAPGFAEMPIEVLAETLARDMRLCGELVITTAERFAPANTSAQPPLADTG
jgi:hypothetical protein